MKDNKPKVPSAPPPVKTIGGGGKGGVSKDREQMDIASYYHSRGYRRDGMKRKDTRRI